jgi:hypothetical protein
LIGGKISGSIGIIINGRRLMSVIFFIVLLEEWMLASHFCRCSVNIVYRKFLEGRKKNN